MTIARRTLIGASLLALPSIGRAQSAGGALERIRFVLNFRPDGGTAGYLLALSRGYYREAGLEVTIDGSSGSGDAVTRVASGNYQMGSADISTLVEFYARNPAAAPKVVMPLHDTSPQAVMSLAAAGMPGPPIWPARPSARARRTPRRACSRPSAASTASPWTACACSR